MSNGEYGYIVMEKDSFNKNSKDSFAGADGQAREILKDREGIYYILAVCGVVESSTIINTKRLDNRDYIEETS